MNSSRRFPILALAALLAAALAFAPATASAKGKGKDKPPAYVPIERQNLKVPDGVQPWLPNWTPDGSHIVFQNQLDGTTWVTSKKGKGTKCVTCDFGDRPEIYGGFTYAFPDDKRLFISHELGGLSGIDSGPNADAFVLECSPSIYDCASHTYLPVDMSEDKGPSTALIVQRRTWHLAPDGEHLGWMDLRLDGTVMIVGRLERQDDHYVVTDQRTINPPGPASLTDTDPEGWANNSQLYELKSFADGGASAIVVGGPEFNVDALKIRLRDGKITRLTGNHDWDEDGAISPDGDLYALYSWRTRHRLDAFSWVPELEPFVEMPAFAGGAPYYVSSWPGFQCDLSPWLLSSSGDDGGRLIGQPLNVYPGNRLTPGNNLSGQQFWSPDSRSVLLQERTRTQPQPGLNEHVEQKGFTPNRIAIARIDRKATKPEKVVSSAVGAWAQPPATYVATTGSGAAVTVNGHGGGTADISYSGNLSAGIWTMTFNHYSKDGKTFLDGSYRVESKNRGSYWSIDADIKVSGKHTGSIKSDLVLNNGNTPLPAKSGAYTAVYDGKKSPPLPELGACYGDLPQKDALNVKAKSKPGGRVVVKVRSSIAGDRRPVQRATVKVGGKSVRTNASGKAVLELNGSGRRTVAVSAGDTFEKAKVKVRVKR